MTDKEISVYYQNVRGLRTKTSDFRYEVSTNNFDLIALTETWLHDGINSSEVFTNDYNVFRHDRAANDHCKNNISVKQL